MPTCPKGHPSEAGDYCDECGAPIGGPTPPAVTASPAPVPGLSGAGPADHSGELCPDCQTPYAGRFCETCGYDFLSRTASPDATADVGSSVSPQGSVVATPAAEPRWRVVVRADREYHDRMMAVADADAEPVAVPAYCPERRFELHGSEVLIGRRSRSRGIEPGVDLAGPPEDAGVSHAHALLVHTGPGTWQLVDLGSANGTYLNGATTPLTPNEPVPIADGDRIHLGAWTTATVETYPDPAAPSH